MLSNVQDNIIELIMYLKDIGYVIGKRDSLTC